MHTYYVLYTYASIVCNYSQVNAIMRVLSSVAVAEPSVLQYYSMHVVHLLMKVYMKVTPITKWYTCCLQSGDIE